LKTYARWAASVPGGFRFSVKLPRSITHDAKLVDIGAFFARLQGTLGVSLACETRNPGWFGEEATALLCERGVTRVISDPAKGQEGPHVPTTATIYVRLYGSPRIYYSSYAPEYLAQLARDMRVHAAAGRDVWLLFDNTAAGAAVTDALALAGSLNKPGATGILR
jgi:uncharacterized protein YecE (DUF72 family)